MKFVTISALVLTAVIQVIASPAGPAYDKMYPYPLIDDVLIGESGTSDLQSQRPAFMNLAVNRTSAAGISSTSDIESQRDGAFKDLDLNTTSSSDFASNSVLSLGKRIANWPPLCIPVSAWGWHGVNYYNFHHARMQLERQANDAYVPINTCKRVSCEKGSAITVCNDNFARSFISPKTISNLAWSMWKYCRWDVKPKDPFSVGGQIFDRDGFNVIVNWDWYCRNW